MEKQDILKSTTQTRQMFGRKISVVIILFAVLSMVFAITSPFLGDTELKQPEKPPSAFDMSGGNPYLDLLVIIERLIMIIPVVLAIFLLRKEKLSLSALGLRAIKWKVLAKYFGIALLIVIGMMAIEVAMDFISSSFSGKPMAWSQAFMSKEQLLDAFPKEWNWKVEDIKAYMSGLALTLLIITLLVAITEELFYRGLIQGLFMQWFKPLYAILLTAFIFAVGHIMYWIVEGYTLASFPISQFFGGIVLGVAYWKYKDISLPIIIHFLMNLLSMLLLLIFWFLIL